MAAAASPSLLIVDDEPEMRGLLAEYFARHGFAVREAADASRARELLSQGPADVAVLDVTMPGENGLSLMRWAHERWPRMPVILLTAHGEPVDRIVGLELGADDYLAKPCELRELLARVRAVLRRASPPPAEGSDRGATAVPLAPHRHAPGPLVAFGLCRLDLDTRRLLGADGLPVEITAAEFDLLALFARHPNRPLNRDQIMEQAHNRSWDVFDRSIDLRIMRLRRKIERNPDKPEVLKTVRNVGYVFVSEADAG